MKPANDNLKAGLWICLLGLLCIYFIPWFISSATLSPDELHYKYVSSHLVSGGEFAIKAAPDDLRFYGMIPRSFGYTRNGAIVPYGSPGYIYVLSGIRKIMPDFAVHLLSPFLLLLCGYVVYRIGGELSLSKNGSQTAGILFLTIPVVINQAYSMFPDVINLLFFLYAVYLLMRMEKQISHIDMTLFFLLAAGMCWIRQTSLIFILVFAVFILLRRRKIIRIKYVLSVFPALLAIAALLYFSKVYFGEYFKTGLTGSSSTPPFAFDVSQALPAPSRTTAYIPLADHIDLGVLINRIRFFPSSLMLAFPAAVLAVIGMIRRYKRKCVNDMLLFTYLMLLLCIFFFGNFKTYGYQMNEMNLHSSFLRYILPLLALLPIWAVFAFPRLWKSKRVLGAVVAVNLAVGIAGPYGLAEKIMMRIYCEEAERFIKANTDAQSVVFTDYWDKSIYPDRLVYRMRIKKKAAIENLIATIETKGYDIYYIENNTQKKILDYMQAHYEIESVSGPKLENQILRLIPPPKKLYPIKLFRLKERKMENT